MPAINYPVRFLKAVLVAVLLGIAFAAIATAQDECDDGCEAVIAKPYFPGLCDALEPYGYAWYFFDCANKTENESVSVVAVDDQTITYQITRVYPDGFIRVQWRTVARRPR